MAHGLGEPVPEALGEVALPKPGSYRVWVRTRDWVAPWKVPGAPGKFQVLVGGQPLTIDQTEPPKGEKTFQPLGQFRFEAGKNNSAT